MASSSAQLEVALEKALSTLYFANVVVEEFQEGSQQTLFNYVNTFVDDLRNLERVQHTVETPIPLDVFELVDRGENPEKYTQLCIDAATERAKLTRGRVAAIELFRDTLRSEMRECFPEEFAKFENEAGGASQVKTEAMAADDV